MLKTSTISTSTSDAAQASSIWLSNGMLGEVVDQDRPARPSVSAQAALSQ